MRRATKSELRKISKAMAKEFPNDPALQQVHIARKVLSLEAKRAGMSFGEYVRSLSRKGRTPR